MGDRGSIFLDDYIPKRWLPGLSERHFWVVEDLHLEGAGKEFRIESLLKQRKGRKQEKKSLRKSSKKRRSGAESHAACLKVNEVEGNVKAVLVKSCSHWTS